MQVDDAISIIQSYVSVLEKSGGGGASVLDTSLLPATKDEIKTAITILHGQAHDNAEKKSLIEVAKSCALFQPDVGDSPISLEESLADGTSWRSIVEPEMQEIELSYQEDESGLPELGS